MAPSYINPTTTVILYEKLDVSIVELETKRSLKVIWTGIHNKEETTLPFLLPKTSMVHDLADHIAKQVTLTPTGSGKIRVFEVSKDGKTQKEFTGSEMIGNIPDPVELFAEVCFLPLILHKGSDHNFQEIPIEELEADDADKVISVFHFSKEVQRTHGVPFKFVVKPVRNSLDLLRVVLLTPFAGREILGDEEASPSSNRRF
jgi:ubiquitin carboxyl-terminal hydrolase 7